MRFMRKVLVRSIPVALLVGIGIVSFSSEAGSSATGSPAVVIAHTTHAAKVWNAGTGR
jgi:hypothetical protein